MKSHHYCTGAYTPDSQSLLMIDQNVEAPKLDILVRESVQNSLDAGDENVVGVDYVIGEYNLESLSRYFRELSTVLSASSTEFIAICDSGTTGLTGPTKISESGSGDRGNYFSLVKGMLDTSKSSRNAGGSWGIGKVIYYKVGINFVIYYSKIASGSGFESRMSAVWLDDGNKKFTPDIERPDSWRGISLWGDPVFDNSIDDYDVLPITDATTLGKEEIEGILSAFSIEPYGDGVTGTTIIIPGFNRKLLEKEIENEQEKSRWWTRNTEEYIWFAIQKWFFPRLSGSNSEIKLLPCINGEPQFGLLPFFKKMQDIYGATYRFDSGFKWKPVNVNVKNTDTGATASYETGIIAWTVVPKSDLKDGAAFDSPYGLCGIETEPSAEGNHGIVVYTRSLGMILTYKDPRLWDKVPSVGDDAYLLGVFRANPNTQYPKPNEYIRTIEDYFRCSEKADHSIWNDMLSYRGISLESNKILERTFSNIARFLREDMSKADSDRLKGRRVTTGRKVADSLFPPGGSFISHEKPQNDAPRAKPTNSKKKSTDFTQMLNLSFNQREDCVAVFADITFGGFSKTILEVSVSFPSSSKSVMNIDMWRDEIGSEFPFKILSVEITDISTDPEYVPSSIALEEGFEKSSEDNRILLKRKGPTRVSINARRNTTLKVLIRVSRPTGSVIPVISVDSGDKS